MDSQRQDSCTTFIYHHSPNRNEKVEEEFDFYIVLHLLRFAGANVSSIIPQTKCSPFALHIKLSRHRPANKQSNKCKFSFCKISF